MNKEPFSYIQFFNEENIDQNLWNSGFFCGDFDSTDGAISKVFSELGLKLQDLIDGSYINRIHADDLANFQSQLDRLNNGLDDSFHCEYRISDDNGKWHWILTQSFVIKRNENYTVSKVIGIDHIVDSKKNVEEYLFNELLDSNLQLEFFKSLGKIANSQENLRDSLKKLKHIVDFDYCSIYTQQDNKIIRLFHYPEKNSIQESDLTLISERLNNSIYPVIIDNVKICKPFSSILILPLNIHNKPIGFIVLCHNDLGFYKGKDLIPVKSISDLLSIVIQNQLIK